jgi:AraC family transcriptional regulator of adaptative response / DNA-3-methyladenine glycosylase II
VRRFNALFKARYRMAPGRLREARGVAALPAALSFDLSFRPPYDWESMLSFLRHRAIEGVEAVATTPTRGRSRRPSRDAACRPPRGAARAAPSRRCAFRCQPSLARAVPAVLSRVKHAFDLTCDPALVATALGALAEAHPGLRVPGTFDGFELAVRAIVGQQISVRAARTLLGRIAQAFGEPLATSLHGPCLVVSDGVARGVAVDRRSRCRLGVTNARARALIGLCPGCRVRRIPSRAGRASRVDGRHADDAAGRRAWTANYIAMRALRLAGRISRERSCRPQGTRRNALGARRAPQRILAAMASLRCHSPLEKIRMSTDTYFDRFRRRSADGAGKRW